MLDLKILKCPIGKMLLVAGFMSIPVFSQTAQQIARFQARTYTSTANSVTLPYRLFIPVNYNPAIRYPIVTALHGNGERGTDNTRQFVFNVAKQWIADSIQARVPHFIFAPHTELSVVPEISSRPWRSWGIPSCVLSVRPIASILPLSPTTP